MQFKVWIFFDQTLSDCLRCEENSRHAMVVLHWSSDQPHLHAVGSPVAPPLLAYVC
jgi:hypothetical protein